MKSYHQSRLLLQHNEFGWANAGLTPLNYFLVESMARILLERPIQTMKHSYSFLSMRPLFPPDALMPFSFHATDKESD